MSEIIEYQESGMPSLGDASVLQSIHTFATTMATGKSSIPDHLKGNTADCMAICLQAMQWGNLNPYVVAQKTHLVNGTLGYEAQLVSAVVQGSTAIVGNFHYRFSDGWEKVQGNTEIKNVTKKGKGGTTYTVMEAVPCWNPEDEKGLFIEVGAVRRGETEITWGEPCYLTSATTRNSPLWVSDPKQQITYLAIKKWCRIHTPGVLLGIYTSDELHEIPAQEHDITPTKSVSEMMKEKALPKAEVVSENPELEKVPEKELCASLMQFLKDAKTLVDLGGVIDTIEAQLSGKNKDKMLEAYGKRLIQVSNKSPMFFIEEMVHQSQYAAISEMINSMEPDKAAKHMDALDAKTESLINSK